MILKQRFAGSLRSGLPSFALGLPSSMPSCGIAKLKPTLLRAGWTSSQKKRSPTTAKVAARTCDAPSLTELLGTTIGCPPKFGAWLIALMSNSKPTHAIRLCTSRRSADTGQYASDSIVGRWQSKNGADLVWFWIGTHAEYDRTI